MSNGPKVFVVDDNRDFVESTERLLQHFGCETQGFCSAEAALEALALSPPDVILADIGMPVLDGYQLARRVRNSPDFAKIVLVAITGHAGEEDRLKAIEAGYDYRLVKPVDAEEFNHLLASIHPHRMP